MSRLWLIVPAAGVGKRVGGTCPKQYLEVAGRPVLAHTLARLHQSFPEARLCLCLAPDDDWFDPALVPFTDWQRVAGGAERVHSVVNALAAVAAQGAPDDLVLVHDVARPCVSADDLSRLYNAALASPDGALLASPVADTIKRDDGQGAVANTEDRRGLWQAQTPQAFRFALLLEALARALAPDGIGVGRITDEASAVEALGRAPRLVAGRRDNIKITHPEDLRLAELILAGDAVLRDLHESS